MTAMRRARRWAFVLIGMAIVGGIAYYVVDSKDYLDSQNQAEAARASVREGMTFAEAGQVIRGAWRHSLCAYNVSKLSGQSKDFSEHLFYLGSHNLEHTGLVLVRTEVMGGEEIVTAVSGEETYRLPLYQNCPDIGSGSP